MLHDDGWRLVATKGTHRQFNMAPNQDVSLSPETQR